MVMRKKKQTAIFDDDFLFSDVFPNMPLGVIVVGVNGQILYASQAASSLIDIPADVLVHQRFDIIRFVHPETSKSKTLPFMLLKQEGHSFVKVSYCSVNEYNIMIPINIYCFSSNDENGKFKYGIFFLEESLDGSVPVNANETQELVSKFFNIISDAAFIVDSGGALIKANDAGLLYIRSCSESGEYHSAFVHADLVPILNRLTSTKEQMVVEAEKQNRFFELSFYPLLGDQGASRYLVIQKDMTQHKAVVDELHQISNYNQLTQLPNRYLFKNSLDHALANAKAYQRIIVINVNIDNFTMINELLGYTKSGIVLTETANVLTSYLKGKGMVGHQGGDEFFLYVPINPEKTDAERVVRDVVDIVSQRLNQIDRRLYITACAGAALSGLDGDTAELLLQNSHSALSVAKINGSNQVNTYSHRLTKVAVAESKMVHQIFGAMKNNEFFIVFQPKVNAFTGKVIGLEALLRWRTSKGTVFLPDKFLPIAEKSGLIVPLGNMAMEMLLLQVKEWCDKGILSVPVSMNLPNNHDDIQRQLSSFENLLRVYRVDAGLIELEISEKALSEDILKCKKLLSIFKSMGVLTAIDDFGTVFSSVGYLKELPVDRLIIDRSIIGKIGRENEFAIASKTMIDLAHTFGLSVIAEGAETMEQVEFLLENQCPNIQGNVFSKPVSVDEIEVFLECGFKPIKVQS